MKKFEPLRQPFLKKLLFSPFFVEAANQCRAVRRFENKRLLISIVTQTDLHKTKKNTSLSFVYFDRIFFQFYNHFCHEIF